MVQPLVGYLAELLDYLYRMPLALRVFLLTVAILCALDILVVTHRAKRQVLRLRQLTDVMAAASRSGQPARALAAVLETLAKAVKARASLVYLLDRPEGTLMLKWLYGLPDAVRCARWGQDGFPQLVLGEAVCYEGWPAAPLGLDGIANRQGDVTIAFAPVSSQDRLLGALAVVWTGWRPVGDDVATLVVGVGEHLGPVVENLEMQDALRAHAATVDEMVEELREREEERRRLIEEIMHDIRSPLATAAARIRLACESGGGIGEENQRLLAAALGGIERALAWANDLLDAEGGQVSLHKERVALSEGVLTSILENARAAAERGGVELCIEVEGTLFVLVDLVKLARVIDNLTGNAVRHTPAGGRVVVRARRNGNCALISVVDTGPGIPPERLARLFDRYYHDGTQERQGLRPAGQGMGLGLAIARRLVELHGGLIWAESTQERGSTFCFTVPLCDETS